MKLAQVERRAVLGRVETLRDDRASVRQAPDFGVGPEVCLGEHVGKAERSALVGFRFRISQQSWGCQANPRI